MRLAVKVRAQEDISNIVGTIVEDFRVKED